MSSWELFRYLLPRRDLGFSQRTPIFMREMACVPTWQRPSELVKRLPLRWLGLLFVAYLAGILIVNRTQTLYCVNTLYLVMLPLLLLSPSLLIWILPLGVALSPIVVRERERESWETLRATPYSVEEILLDKARAALWSLYGALGGIGILQVQVLAMIVFGAGVMQAISATFHGTVTGYGSAWRGALCAWNFVLILMLLGVFFLDRAQELMMMVVAALAVGTSSSSMRSALTNGLIAVGLAWAMDVAVAIGVLAIQPAGAVRDIEFSIAAMITLGPLAGYLVELDPLPIIIAVGLTLLGREVVIRRLWTVTIHGAERL
jgi:hypothetical protein